MKQDLIILCADSNIEQTLRGMLTRYEAFDIRRRLSFDAFVHPHRDPGVFNEAHEFLRGYSRLYEHALAVFDHAGSGQENVTASNVEGTVEDNLRRTGWGDRAAAVVIDPELERWVWSESRQVDHVLGWHGRSPSLREWLIEKGFLDRGQIKPLRPKEAMEAALYEVRNPRSSALYYALARKVSLRKCGDRAFLKVRARLTAWFHES